MDHIVYRPIGIIHSPYVENRNTPIQAVASKDVQGEIEVMPEYAEGLKDLDGFSHAIILYHFHAAKAGELKVTPYLDSDSHGVFATRAPSRPNPIGLSIVKIIRMEGNTIYIEGFDMLDGTPLLDIKPYVPEFDSRENVRIGWLEGKIKKMENTKDDGRFANEEA